MGVFVVGLHSPIFVGVSLNTWCNGPFKLLEVLCSFDFFWGKRSSLAD